VFYRSFYGSAISKEDIEFYSKILNNGKKTISQPYELCVIIVMNE